MVDPCPAGLLRVFAVDPPCGRRDSQPAVVMVDPCRVKLPFPVVVVDFPRFAPIRVLLHLISSLSMEQGLVHCHFFFALVACIFAARYRSDLDVVDRLPEWQSI